MCQRKLRRWELALLVGVALAALTGGWLNNAQSSLSGQVVRLHVVANSDSAADQALKLKVRDAVVAQAMPDLEDMDRQEALNALAEALPEIGRTAAETVAAEGYHDPVTVSLEERYYPTKTHGELALPAGRYTALRLDIGRGAGRNWWCVVFPTLCADGVAEGVDREALGLMTGEDPGYVVKFKAMEWWGELKEKLR